KGGDQLGGDQLGGAGRLQRVYEKLGKLFGRRPFEGETDTAAAVERRQLVGAQPLQQAAIAGEHHGEENLAVEAGGRQEAQLGEDSGLHLLRLVGDEHRARQGG